MLKYISVLILIIAPYIGAAQNASATDGGKSCFIDPMPVIIKTSPLAPLYKNKMVTLGLEVPVYKNISLSAEGGYIYATFECTEKLIRSKPNYDLRLDAKYYLPIAQNLRLYTGPLISYRQTNSTKGDIKFTSTYDEAGNETVNMSLDMTNAMNVNRQTVNVLWQAGIQPVLCSRITFNLFASLGLGMDHNKTTSEEGEIKRSSNNYLGSLAGVQLGFAF